MVPPFVSSDVPPALATAINTASAKYGVDPNLMAAIWVRESGSTFPNPAVNSSGYGGLFGTKNWNASTQAQANAAAKILSERIAAHGGDISAALWDYSGHGYKTLPYTPATPGRVTFTTAGKPDALTRGAVQLVKTYLGTPYVWGGENPGGFDCSGLLQYVWAQNGVPIPRTTYDQWTTGHAIDKSQLMPGDAVFFTGSDPKNGKPGHVGMYIGGGKFIEAPHSGSVVRISNLSGRNDYVGARRWV